MDTSLESFGNQGPNEELKRTRSRNTKRIRDNNGCGKESGFWKTVGEKALRWML